MLKLTDEIGRPHYTPLVLVVYLLFLHENENKCLNKFTVGFSSPNESAFHSADASWLLHNHYFALSMSLLPHPKKYVKL